MIREIKEKISIPELELYDISYENYKLAMKSNFTKDSEQAIGLMNLRKKNAEKCDNVANDLDFSSWLLIEKIKLINTQSSNIARAYIKLGS